MMGLNGCLINMKIITPLPIQIGSDGGSLALWLDAADTSVASITETSGSVSAWIDKSGSGNTIIQTTGSRQPSTGVATINGNNAIRFDGSSSRMYNDTFNTTPNITFFFVAKPTAASDALSCLFSLKSSNDFQVQANTVGQFDNTFNSNNLGVSLQSGTDTLGTTNLYDYRLSDNDGNFIMTRNGSQVAIDTGYNGNLTTSQKLRIAANRGVNRFLGGDYGEIIIFNKDLSTAESAAVRQYLNRKWAIY